jgi:hypothetical protein
LISAQTFLPSNQIHESYKRPGIVVSAYPGNDPPGYLAR